MKTLREHLQDTLVGFNIPNEAIKAVKKWLQECRKEWHISTVTSMDCELSGIRDETFEKLLEELEK